MIFKQQLLLILLMFPCFLFGQKMQVSGNVVDTAAQKPLENAVAMVIRIKDSVLVDFQRTDQQGGFAFNNLEIDTVQLIISHPRFGDQSYYLFGSADNHLFPVRKVTLPPKSQEIAEVIIYAYKDPIYYKGDTLVYVADSFATKPNAVVEDLLKKLPGIKVNADGSITSQGKEISQVLVDGDEFFGADATVATKNLAAKGVESVQVYEKKDENSTDSDDKIQVLDLKLKDEAKKGYFGKVSGATDFNRFYEGEFLANKFNQRQKISVFALASNTTRSSLEWRDAYKYGMNDDMGYNEDEDMWYGGDWNSGNDVNGIPQTWKTGVYYNDKISDKTKLAINYTYDNNSLKSQESNRSQYFLADTSYVTDEVSSSRKKNEGHSLNLKWTQTLDSLTSFEFEPKLKLNKSMTSSLDETNFITETDTLARQTAVRNNNDADGTSLNAKFTLNRNFKKKDRKLTASYRFGYDENESVGNLYSLNRYLLTTNIGDTINQEKDNVSLSQSHTAQLAYVEPLNLKFKLQVDYEFYNNNSSQSKQAANFVNGAYSDIDESLTNKFENKKMQHMAGAQLIYDVKKQRISVGVKVRNVQIENYNLVTLNTISQNVTNILPRLRYRYKFSNSQQLQLNYTTSSSQPSINQLQPVPDNSNPNRIVLGNAALLPNYSHRMNLNYNSYKPISGRYVYAGGNFSVVDNAFANSIQYDAFGRTASQTVNVDGNLNGSAYAGAGFPFRSKMFELQPNVNMGYSKSNNFINAQKNITTELQLGGGLQFVYQTDSLEISIAGNFGYNDPTSTISSSSNKPYSQQSYTANARWTLPFRFGIETDATYTINSQRAAGYDLNFLIWNASVTRSFLKNENLILSAHIYDMLNQNINAQRAVEDNVITDSKSNIIARYFLLKLTYKFNSTKTKESDDDF
jgi:hypothetical protein